MRSIQALVSELRRANIRVWSDGDRLRYRAPAGALTVELKSEMRQRKGELLEFCRRACLEPQPAPLVQIARNGPLTISPSQQRLWLLQQIEGPSPTYNVAQSLQLSGRLDFSALERSLSEIICRHEALRTTFTLVGDEVRQRIAPFESFALPVIDVLDGPHDQRLADVHRQAHAESMRAFDLEKGPLVRFVIWRVDDERHVLQVVLHHIISDGHSIGILMQELASLYEALHCGRQPSLPKLILQCADFAAWQRASLREGQFASELEYWRRQLDGLPPLLELPADRPRPATQTSQGAFHRLRIDASLLAELKKRAAETGSTLYTGLLTALAVVLSRFTGRTDIPIGCPVSQRDRPEIDRLIGFFINTLVLRLDLSGDPAMHELLARARDVLFDGMAHQNLPFEKLVEALVTERNTSYSPLVQVTAMLLGGEELRLSLPGLEIEPFEVEQPVARFDLALEMYEKREAVEVIWIYNSDLFDAATVARMADHFLTVLKRIASDPACRLSELPLLSEFERRLLLVEWNDTAADYPRDMCVNELFEEQVRWAPEATAVEFEDQRLTYAELNGRSNQLAHHLRSLGVGPEALVGLCMARSPQMIVGLLGILKAGGAYVPLDPHYPQERLGFMIDDARISILLTQSKIEPQLPAHRATTLCLDRVWDRIASVSCENPASTAGPQNAVYVIYTSGSTGTPKGTVLEHRNVVNYLAWARRAYEVAGGCGAPVSSSIGFDATVTSLLTPLVSGRGVALLPEAYEIEQLARALQSDREFSLVKITPSHLEVLRQSLSNQAVCGRTRAYVIGGEALTASHLNFWREFAPGVRLINEYGPTETTVGCCVYEVPQEGTIPENVPIGRPISNTRLYVLDRNQQPVPIGMPGELYICGDGVARGYLNRPELTAERFIADPFGNDPAARMYKSGDLCRWLPDGNLEYLGRMDQQVKIRGFRIELGEIESVLMSHERVREAVVLAREEQPSGKRLVAYVVVAAPGDNGRKSTVSSSVLREHLSASLPEYMVPSAFVFLDELPLTPNGKIDRRRLPAPEWNDAPAEEKYVAPRTPTEDVLVGIWSEVLQQPHVGMFDNFFHRGGHSLVATQLVSRVNLTFQVDLPVRIIFQSPTIAEMALAVDGARRSGGAAAAPSLKRIPRDGELPLSFAQERLWFLEQLEGPSETYNISTALRLLGPLDHAGLQQCLQEIVRRHESLRTTIRSVRGEPVQRIHNDGEIRFEVIDLRQLGDESRQAELQRRITAETRCAFDLAAGPLLRLALFELGPEEHVLAVTMHHIVSDGWSANVLVDELAALYEAHLQGELCAFPELPFQYADFAVWQREFLRDEVLEEQIAYWRRQLKGAPAILELPTDHPRPSVQTYRGRTTSFELGAELVGKLQQLSLECRVTLFMTLHAAFATLLHRYSGQDDIVLGSGIANRNRLETESLVGFFVNILPLRTDLSGVPTFRKLLDRVREVDLAAYDHQDVPFEKLVEHLQPERDMGHTPIFQVNFTLQNLPGRRIQLPGLTVEPIKLECTTSRFDLTVLLHPHEDGMQGVFEYRTDLFDRATIDRLAGHYRVLLEAAVADPQGRIGQLPLLSEAERRQILVEWTDTALDYPRDTSIHELFEAQVERTPDGVALTFGGQQLTYAELNCRANQLARYLAARGVRTGALVGLFVDRSLDMVVAMIGILKTGGAYVPLDTAYPKQRLTLMLDDCGASMLLTQEHLRDLLPAHDVEVVCLDSDWRAIGTQDSSGLGISVTSEQPAYVIYTSGSTGVPKGVVVPHRSVNRLVLQTDYISLEASDIVAQASNASFDAATFEIWGALLNGTRLVGIERDVTLAPDRFAAVLRDARITTLFLTTALFNQMSHEAPGAFVGLRHLLFGGELVDPQCVRNVLRDGPPERLLHVYGPTENTTFSTWRLVDEVPEDATTVPIGKAIANTQLYVLDTLGQPVPIGVPGELYLGGDGLALEYLHQPELTAERFVANPFDSGRSRLYRTGDDVRWLADGSIEFLGRRDNQVKIRGFRIELGEIEAALLKSSHVREAVVLAPANERGERELAAYIVPEPSSVPDPRGLRDELARRLPAYMVPARYSLLDSIPLNVNGKVDRAKLPPPAAPLTTRYVAPRTETERLLADIFAEVLGIAEVGVEDNFFELGGHSLIATQVASRVRESFSLELPLRQLFQSPTVAGLAGYLDAQCRRLTDETAVVRPAERDGPAPLSFAQERLWFLDQLEPGNPFYNVPSALRLKGELCVSALENGIREITQRHEVLRSSYPAVDGKPSQSVADRLPTSLPIVDLTLLPSEERATQVHRRVASEARRPFDLSTGPLIRAQLLQLACDEHVLLFTMHHIVADGWSLGVLVQEIARLYRARLSPASPDDSAASSAGGPVLPALPIQYADFAAWQREWLQGDVLESQLRYWRKQLADAPPALELPTDRPRPPAQSYQGSSVRFVVDAATTAGLRNLTREREATLFMTLLAAWAVLLYRYSGQDDVMIGSPIANRNRREIEPLIGFFVNTLALRIDLAGNPTFLELVDRVRHVALDAYTHQDLPFERLVDEIQPERDLSLNPLFQVMFALQNMPFTDLKLPGLSVDFIETKRVAALFDLVLDVWELGDSLTGVLEYNTDLFDEATIQRVVECFQTMLRDVATVPTRRVDDVALLTGAEQETILTLGRGRRVLYPVDRTIPQLFEETVVRGRDCVAVVHNGRRETYADLNIQANRIAYWLRDRGVGRGDFVGILLDRGSDCLAAMLGVLKAGGAFLPIDPAYPAERVRYMLADSGIQTLVSRAQTFAACAGATDDAALHSTSPLCWLDLSSDALSAQSSANPDHVNTADDVAYVLYTSGSTGLPKGAMVRHNGAINHIFAEFDLLAFDSDSAFLQSAPSSSDISVWQFLSPLLIGGKTVVADHETVCDPSRLFQTIKSESVTLIELVPVVMSELLEYVGGLAEVERELPALQWALITGEAAPVSVVNRWLETYPGIRLVNAYGPTEAADDICQHVIERPVPAESRSVPIGRPLANLTLFVLDGNLRPVPLGVPGEICVAGIGVGAGYWNNEAKTSENFVANPYSCEVHDQVLYRTGDLGRWLPDGSLECLDRLDRQVKLRGFRIELGEIEGVLSRHPAAGDVAVIVREDEPGDKRLVAYVAPRESSDEVRQHLCNLTKQQVNLWQDLHEDSYRDTLDYGDPTFNVIGWDSNYTNQPLPQADMREYVDFTVERILGLQPRRLLEIGCGTGLIMFPLLPHLDEYAGTDLSHVAIQRLRQLQESADLARRVPGLSAARLVAGRADDVEWIERGRFDTAVLPSVVQYFPGIDYLLKVLEGLIRHALEPGGAIFLGDIRSLPLLEAFHASVQMSKADDDLTLMELNARVRSQLVSEQELAIDPAFFDVLPEHFPEIARIDVLPKRGRHQNEMTRFRYDVLLRLRERSSSTNAGALPLASGASGERSRCPASPDWIDWQRERSSVDDVRRRLADELPDRLVLRCVANRRVQESVQTAACLADGDSFENVGQLRTALAQAEIDGIDPEHFLELSEHLPYQVEVTVCRGDRDGGFDVFFTRRGQGGLQSSVVERARPATTLAAQPKTWSAYANNPLREKLARRLIPELREFLRTRIPNYMVPSDVMILDALPLTPAGKIDRRALPRPDVRRADSDGYAAPRNHEEEVMCRVWADILGVERVGIQDNFFELGGHSLKATQAVSRVHRELCVEIALREIFARPTIQQLAESLSGRCVSHFQRIARIPDAEHYELSHAQRRLWVLSQMEDGLAAYNMPAALALEGSIDLDAFQQALEALVERHESLRTAFVVVDGKPRQQVAAHLPTPIRVVDLTDDPDPEDRARELAKADAMQPFDLQSGPLLRVTLLKLSAGRHALLFNIHHIVADDWSMNLLVREVVLLYDAQRRGRTSPLPPLPIQYRDYAAWQNRYLASDGSHRDREYWLTRLGGDLPVLDPPADRPRPAVKTYRGRWLSWQLDEHQTAGLESLARRRGASLFMTLMALLKTLLYRYTGQEDIIVGFPIAGRDHPDLESQIGFFVNMLPLRTRLAGESTFEALLDRIKTAAAEAYEHQAYPFDRLVDELNVSRDVSRHPLFDVVAVMISDPPEELSLEGVRISGLMDEYEGSKFDLHFVFEQRAGRLEGSIVYNTDLFLPARIERMIAHLRELIQNVLEDPGAEIGRVNILPPAERRQLLADWGDGAANFNNQRSLVAMFEAQAAQSPADIAVVCPPVQGDESSPRCELTYAQLNERANQLAHLLSGLGVGPEVLVGLYLDRSADMVAAVLGVLKAGGAYVPFDAAQPAERLAFMFKDARVAVLVTQQRLAAQLPEHSARTVYLDASPDAIGQQSPANPPPAATPDNTAYVIFTSGSTGRPKGVPVTHRNVTRLFDATDEWFHFGRHDVWTLFHSYAFDFSVWEMWGALLYGGRLVIVPHWTVRSPEAFYRLLADERVTVLNQTPSAFRQLIAVEERQQAVADLDLRFVIFGGESLDVRSLRPWMERHGEDRPRLINMYGITETTVHVTYRPLTAADLEQPVSRIGRPIPDLQIYILDRRQDLVPIGVPGEICVGGAGIARGYLHRPELTEERFIANPFSDEPNARLYRSGDLARYLPDGDIEYLGRIDHQVQIRGFRVELGEIEAALAAHPGIRQPVVIAQSSSGNVRLIAYFVSATAPAPNTGELRRHLADKLPDYMIPSAFVRLDEFPLTENGKLDRNALPAPTAARTDIDAQYVRPAHGLEQTIAGILGEVLGIEQVGLHDNFFDLGAHSLSLIEVHRNLQERLCRKLSVVLLFVHPTVSALADHLGAPEDQQAGPANRASRDRAAQRKAARRRQQERTK